MFKSLGTLNKIFWRLCPYFMPSKENAFRVFGLFTAVVVVPTVNYVALNMIMNSEEEEPDSFDLGHALASAVTLSVISGIHRGITDALTNSTVRAMKAHNIKKLLDESKYLMYGNTKDISSLQYVTVGQGVRDFASNAISLCIELPMYSLITLGSLISMSIALESYVVAFIIVGGTTVTAALIKKANDGLYFHVSNNQNIENLLVGKVNAIESYRNSIPLMNGSDAELKVILQYLKKVGTTTPKIGCWSGSFAFSSAFVTSIASQFVGGYYKNGVIDSISNPKAITANLMFVGLANTLLYNLLLILSESYFYAELNLKQLEVFDSSYQEYLTMRRINNKVKITFDSNIFLFQNFSVYRPSQDTPDNMVAIVNSLNLELVPNKIYRLLAESGGGKTTFLKAITDNWIYTDGSICMPQDAKDRLCFIPQGAFIPSGSLLEILTYPFGVEEFLAKYGENTSFSNIEYILPVAGDSQSRSPIDLTDAFYLSNALETLLYRVKLLLRAVGFLGGVTPSEIQEQTTTDWSIHLSGGEKQKIAVVRALLKEPKFIIMDEATSALDPDSKKCVFELIKRYLSTVEDYLVIYTEHADYSAFADITIELSGDGNANIIDNICPL